MQESTRHAIRRPIRQPIRQLGVVLAASALAIGTTAGGALAAGGDESPYTEQARAAGLSATEAAELQDGIDRHRQDHPGAKQINLNQIRWENGATMTFSMPDRKPRSGRDASGTAPRANPDCPAGWVCLYENADYEHDRPGSPRRLDFTTCGPGEHLDHYGFADKASSIHNNQTRGTASILYNWTGSAWDPIWQGAAPIAEPQLGANDEADGLKVC